MMRRSCSIIFFSNRRTVLVLLQATPISPLRSIEGQEENARKLAADPLLR
jgi:hypothetical protein